jgi:hypothetical protein
LAMVSVSMVPHFPMPKLIDPTGASISISQSEFSRSYQRSSSSTPLERQSQERRH